MNVPSFSTVRLALMTVKITADALPAGGALTRNDRWLSGTNTSSCYIFWTSPVSGSALVFYTCSCTYSWRWLHWVGIFIVRLGKRKWRLRLGVFIKYIGTWSEPGFSSLVVKLIRTHVSGGVDERGESPACRAGQSVPWQHTPLFLELVEGMSMGAAHTHPKVLFLVLGGTLLLLGLNHVFSALTYERKVAFSQNLLLSPFPLLSVEKPTVAWVCLPYSSCVVFVPGVRSWLLREDCDWNRAHLLGVFTVLCC